jgi:hypothetical protein
MESPIHSTIEAMDAPMRNSDNFHRFVSESGVNRTYMLLKDFGLIGCGPPFHRDQCGGDNHVQHHVKGAAAT